MNSATVTRSLATLSSPQYVIVDYEYAMGADSTAFISVSLPGLAIDEPSYRENLRTNLAGHSYAIDLSSISISCGASNFEFQLFNTGDGALNNLNTIYQILSASAIDKSYYASFNKFIIRNEDQIPTDSLYLELRKYAGTAGTVKIQLIYTTLQDRAPVE